MAHINIAHNGQYACFSTITGTLVTPFMGACAYEKWREREYGLAYCKPIIKQNTQTLKEALSNTRLNETHEGTLNSYADCGILISELEQLLQEIEDENYTPRKNELDQYECPSCGGLVAKGQCRCSNERCGLQFFRAAGFALRVESAKQNKKTFYRYVLHQNEATQCLTCDVLEDYEEHDGNYYKNHRPAIYAHNIKIVLIQEQDCTLSLLLTEPDKKKAISLFSEYYERMMKQIQQDAAEKVKQCQAMIQQINNV